MDNSAPQNNAQQEPDDLQYTQETQQATQEASQEDQSWTNDSVYWGCLQPCKSESGIEPVMFSRAKEQYSLGRGDSNDVQLRGLKISVSFPSCLPLHTSNSGRLQGMRHCRIVWDGEDAGISNGKASLTGVTIHDSSTNGTFVRAPVPLFSFSCDIVPIVTTSDQWSEDQEARLCRSSRRERTCSWLSVRAG